MTACINSEYPPYFCFDAEYVDQLRDGIPAVREHFAEYFGELLRIKLRRRLRSRQLVDDIRQETLLRVLQLVRRNGGIRYPERLGGLVISVCNNVLREFLRAETRHKQCDHDTPEPADDRLDVERPLINEQRKGLVKRVLTQLPEKDTEVLSMIFLEERDRSEVCRELGINRNYLRILLHRAKSRFKKRLMHPVNFIKETWTYSQAERECRKVVLKVGL